jgi:hypothetical protein
LTAADLPRCDPPVDFGATKPPAAADAKAGESELMNHPVHGGTVSSRKVSFGSWSFWQLRSPRPTFRLVDAAHMKKQRGPFASVQAPDV